MSTLALAACAPTVQSVLAPAAAFRPPRFDGDRLVSFDGARLGLSAWPAKAPGDALSFAPAEPWAVIVGLHGMNDYAETFYLAAPYWAARGVTTYAYDARGFGRSPHRGIWPGSALMAADLRAAVAAVRARHPGAIVAVVGASMGAAEAMVAFAGADPPAADRLVLCAPAVWGWSAMPMAYSVSLWAAAHTLRGRKVTPPRGLKITPSDNIEMLRKIGRDRHMLFDTRFDAIYGLVDLMDEAAQAGAGLRVPTAFLYGANDQIIPKKAALAAARRLPADARTALYPKSYHMILRDLKAAIVWEDILAFLRDPRAPFPSGAPPLVPVTNVLTPAG